MSCKPNENELQWGGNEPLRWTFDDSLKSQAMGWLLAVIDHTGKLELLVSTRYTTRAVLDDIRQRAPTDPLCAKALHIMSAQRLLYPTHKFAYADENA